MRIFALIIMSCKNMYLYHYYDKDIGPFKNISELPDEEAAALMERLAVEKKNAFCNKRNLEYLAKRHYLWYVCILI